MRISIGAVLRRIPLAAALATAVFLVACGGGDSSQDPGSQDVATAGRKAAMDAAVTVSRSFSDVQVVVANYFQIEGCNRLNLDVIASRETHKAGAPPVETLTALVQVFLENTCTGDTNFLSGNLDAPVIEVATDLGTASVRGTGTLVDFFLGATKTVSIDLNTTGGSLTESPPSRFVFGDPGSGRTFVFNNLQALRINPTVSGSLVLDGTDLLSASSGGSITVRIAAAQDAVISIFRNR